MNNLAIKVPSTSAANPSNLLKGNFSLLLYTKSNNFRNILGK
jgi:hypothetical protein